MRVCLSLIYSLPSVYECLSVCLNNHQVPTLHCLLKMSEMTVFSLYMPLLLLNTFLKSRGESFLMRGKRMRRLKRGEGEKARWICGKKGVIFLFFSSSSLLFSLYFLVAVRMMTGETVSLFRYFTCTWFCVYSGNSWAYRMLNKRRRGRNQT